MKESLFALLKLQEVDNEVDSLRKHKSDYPQRVAELEQLIATLGDERKNKREELAKQEANLRHFGQQLVTAEDDFKRHQARMPEIKTNREYDALQQEMMALQHAIDEFQEEKKKAAEEAQRLTAAIEEDEQQFAEKTQSAEVEIAGLREKVRTLDEEIAQAIDRRKAVAAEVPARAVTMYERVRRGKKRAVVRVVRDACSGCWTNLPPQKINELRMSRRIIMCDGCGRILVWDDRQGNAS